MKQSLKWNREWKVSIAELYNRPPLILDGDAATEPRVAEQESFLPFTAVTKTFVRMHLVYSAYHWMFPLS